MTNRKTDGTCHCEDTFYDKETIIGVYNCVSCTYPC